MTKPPTTSLNVMKKPLANFSKQPMTGFYRNGFCDTGPEDPGNHSVAAVVTKEFLEFSASRGNDLRGIISPGCKWCLCAGRWKEALNARKDDSDPVVPKYVHPKTNVSLTPIQEEELIMGYRVFLHATHEAALNSVDMKDLKKFAAEGEAQNNGSVSATRTAVAQNPGTSSDSPIKEV
ncbi:MAG: hypothetical protein M1827_001316 [Pycnora praestabilis]|nr:MAG: hypothetical protein M1827_001316 [Pycnora praestabilis]